MRLLRSSCVMLRLLMVLAVPVWLAACGDLPEPFLGNPGATARRLAVPDTPMLAVPSPANALLNPPATDDFAELLALSLQKEEVPTLARKPHKTDWRLAVSADVKGDRVVPRYAILDPAGKEQGAVDGAALPAAGWTAGAPSTLGEAAQDAVPKILALMLSIRATRDRADPHSLLNRVAKLYVPAVTGAPGDGDPELTKLIRTGLAEFGPLVQTTPDGADFTVEGKVTVTPLPRNQQQVEIAWTVTSPRGAVVGKVSQLNAVPAGTLDHFWGDIAAVVAQEASGGINTVVQRFIGREDTVATKRATPPRGPPGGGGAGVITVPPGGGAGLGGGTAPGGASVPNQNGASIRTTAPAAGAPPGSRAAIPAVAPAAATRTVDRGFAPVPATRTVGRATAPMPVTKTTASGMGLLPGNKATPGTAAGPVQATAGGKTIAEGKGDASKRTSPSNAVVSDDPASPAAK
jgi:hypothetical protein